MNVGHARRDANTKAKFGLAEPGTLPTKVSKHQRRKMFTAFLAVMDVAAALKRWKHLSTLTQAEQETLDMVAKVADICRTA